MDPFSMILAPLESHHSKLSNGTTIIDVDLAKIKQTPDIHPLKRHPGIKNKKGHIGFLGHGSVVEFRNIRIKDLGGAAEE